MKIQLTGDCRSFFAELQSCLPPQEICDSLLHRISGQLPNTLSARRRNHRRARELPTDSSPRHISRAPAGSDRVGLQIVLSFVNTPSTWRRRRRRSGFRRSAIAVQLVLWRNLVRFKSAQKSWLLYVQCKKNQRGRWWAELLLRRRNRRKKLIEEGRLSGLGFGAPTFRVAYLKYHWSCCCCCICMYSVGRIREELKYCWGRKQEEEDW